MRFSDGLQRAKHFGKLVGFVDFPVFLRCQTDACAIGTAPHIRPAIGGRRRPSRFDQFLNRQAGIGNRLFDSGDVVITGPRRNWVLPYQLFLRHFRPEIAAFRAHVTVQQFEPSASKGVGKLVDISVEGFRYFAIFRIGDHRNVSRVHGRQNFFTRPVNFRSHICIIHVFRMPDMRASRAGCKLPLIFEQHVEIAIIPLDRVGSPRAFQTGCDGIGTLAAGMC